MKESLKILVVDDDLDIIKILKYNLNNSGYFVKSANNGIKAIKKTKKITENYIENLELYSDKYDEKISPAQFEKQD